MCKSLAKFSQENFAGHVWQDWWISWTLYEYLDKRPTLNLVVSDTCNKNGLILWLNLVKSQSQRVYGPPTIYLLRRYVFTPESQNFFWSKTKIRFFFTWKINHNFSSNVTKSSYWKQSNLSSMVTNKTDQRDINIIQWNFLNWTLNKPKSCINWTLNKVLM